MNSSKKTENSAELWMPDYFKNPRHSITVMVVGAGGTGSELLVKLGRIAYTLNAVHDKDLMVVLVDDDTVTEANMGRQLFTEAELGESKAKVLIERVNRFYGTNWMAIPDKWHPDYMENINVLITCTDNVESRRQIAESDLWKRTYVENELYFWVDVGNDYASGNVIISSKNLRVTGDDIYLPNAFEIFGNIKNHKNMPSCSLAEAIKKQHIMVNPIAADITASFLWDMFTQPKISHIGAFFNWERMTIKKVPFGYYKKPTHERLSRTRTKQLV